MMAFVDPLPRRDRPRVFRISPDKWAVHSPHSWLRNRFDSWAEALDYANTVAGAIRMTPAVPPSTWPTTPIQPMRPGISLPPSDRTYPVYPYWNPQVWCSAS